MDMFRHLRKSLQKRGMPLGPQKRVDDKDEEFRYPYAPLDLSASEIRLLTIAPHDQFDSNIHGALNTVSICQNPLQGYEALSYVWGDPTDRATMYLEGVPVRVTSNLYVALRYLRQTLTSRTLWIDALCINQADVAERNHQLRLMSHIYSRSSLVLIWLGDHDSRVEEAMTIIQQRDIGTARKLTRQRAFDESDLEYHGLAEMLKKKWWRRIWVIQEVLLATQIPLVGCGHTWLRWDKLAMALERFARSMVYHARWPEGIVDTWIANPLLIIRFVSWNDHWQDRFKHASMPGKGIGPFAEIIKKTRGRNATDHRDQIYATLGLVREEDQGLLPVPDYSKPVSQVFQEAMVAILKSEKSLEFLKHASDDRQLQLASWCVDFSKSYWVLSDEASRSPSIENATVVERYLNAITHDPHSGTLRVLGKPLGKAAFFGSLAVKREPSNCSELGLRFLNTLFRQQTSPTPAQTLAVVDGLFKRIFDFTLSAYKGLEIRLGPEEALQRITAGKIWETIGRCVSLHTLSSNACHLKGISIDEEEDRINDYSLTEAFAREFHPEYANSLRRYGIYCPLPTLPKRERLYQTLGETFLSLIRGSHECFWLVTRNGFMALVEKELREGDLLCVISGCETPCILRPAGGETFELLGMAVSTDFQEDDFRRWTKEAEEREFVLR